MQKITIMGDWRYQEKFFLSMRAGEQWNTGSIPAAIKHARTAAGFKTAYAKHREGMI
jgi:hypothetical protein